MQKTVADTGFLQGGFYFKIALETFRSHKLKTPPFSAHFSEKALGLQATDLFLIISPLKHAKVSQSNRNICITYVLNTLCYSYYRYRDLQVGWGTSSGVDNQNLFIIEYLDYSDVWCCGQLCLHE